ncbi:peptidoglycan-binding protein [Streptomyces cellulosae]|nr:peptidoglycan-binding protein [Streptomyces cellulosae]
MSDGTRKMRAWSASVVGVLLSGLVGGGFAVAPAATAVTAPCTRAVSLSDEVIDPTSYEYIPDAAANTSSCYLGRGMSGAAVTALQKDLISCYGYKPATDGVYGELTESAVVAVQQSVGVKADGDYGSSTRDAMKWANCSLPTGARISCT